MSVNYTRLYPAQTVFEKYLLTSRRGLSSETSRRRLVPIVRDDLGMVDRSDRETPPMTLPIKVGGT
jgi:hypothetical protein